MQKHHVGPSGRRNRTNDIHVLPRTAQPIKIILIFSGPETSTQANLNLKRHLFSSVIETLEVEFPSVQIHPDAFASRLLSFPAPLRLSSFVGWLHQPWFPQLYTTLPQIATLSPTKNSYLFQKSWETSLCIVSAVIRLICYRYLKNSSVCRR